MKKTVLALVLTGLAAPAGAVGQADIVSMLLDTTKTLFEAEGYRETGWVERGAVADEGETRHSVALTGGVEHAFIGVCDENCSDLDLEVFDAAGQSVGKDEETDDSPIVDFTPQADDRYQVVVRMADCEQASCHYGVRSFRK